MSKMSQLHAELSEQAIELGFESLEEAVANGYEVDYEEQQLINPYVLVDKAHEEVHEAWLREKQQVLNELTDAIHDDELGWRGVVRRIEHAIEFVENCKG